MPRVKSPDGELRDEIRQPLYDGIYQAAAESPIGQRQFFSNVQGKALYLTNLRQNNLLEATVSFRVMGLCFDAQNIYPDNRGILPLVMQNSSFSFKVGEKIYWQGNGLYISGRMDQEYAVARSSGTGEAAGTLVERAYQRYGDLAVQPVNLTGKHVIDIPPLQSFRVDWVTEGMTAGEITAATPAADTRILYLLSLKGLQRRPVQ